MTCATFLNKYKSPQVQQLSGRTQFFISQNKTPKGRILFNEKEIIKQNTSQ